MLAGALARSADEPGSSRAPRVASVSLVKQAGLEEPLVALARLGSAVDETAEPKNSGVHSSRHLVTRALRLSCSGNGAALGECLRELVSGTVRFASGTERNRTLFLAALLAADPACAIAIAASPGAIDGLCDAMCGAPHLSVTERQWAVLALSGLARQPQCAPRLLRSDLPRRLLDLLHSAVGELLEEQRRLDGGAAEARGGSSTADASDASQAATVGLFYAAVAAISNLSLASGGAKAVLRVGLLPPLLQLLTSVKGTLSVPSVKWLFSGRRTIIPHACIGGVVSRALLNMALTSHHCMGRLRAPAVVQRLHALCADPAASVNLQQIARACLRGLRAPAPPMASPTPTHANQAAATAAVQQPAATSPAITAEELGSGSMRVATPSEASPLAASSAPGATSPTESASSTPATRLASTADADHTPTDSPTDDDEGELAAAADVAVACEEAAGEEAAGEAASDRGSASSAPTDQKTHKWSQSLRKRRKPDEGDAVADGGGADGAKDERRRDRKRSLGESATGQMEFESILSRRIKSKRLEYLVKWRRTSGRAHRDDEATSWVAAHHLHDPDAVAAYERGPENAEAYRDWAWALDPNGAGWNTLPLPVVSDGGGGGKATRLLRAEDGASQPDNWPSDVQYTPFLLWESTTHAMLRLRTVACRPLAAVRILKVPPSHPASVAAAAARHTEDTQAAGSGADGGSVEDASCGDGEARGLFARCAIPSGTWIGDFTGLVKAQRVGDASRYLLEVFHEPNLGIKLDVDAAHFGNETRFINDYTGLAKEPNVSFTVYRNSWTGELAVGVITLDSIRCAEELLADYGHAFWNAAQTDQERATAVPRPPTDAIEASPPAPTAAAARPASAQASTMLRVLPPCAAAPKPVSRPASAPARSHAEGDGASGLAEHCFLAPWC